MANPFSRLMGSRSTPAAGQGGGFSGAARRGVLSRKIQRAAGSPSAMIQALSEADPDGGEDLVSVADVYEILSSLGVTGLSAQALFVFVDTVTDASEPISETVQILPGMVWVVQFKVKGADVAAAGGMTHSFPTHLDTVKIGNNNVNNGNYIPFRVAEDDGGYGIAVYEFTPEDKTGPSLTANANCNFVTGSTGVWLSTIFENMASAKAWLENTGGI